MSPLIQSSINLPPKYAPQAIPLSPQTPRSSNGVSIIGVRLPSNDPALMNRNLYGIHIQRE